MLLFINKFEIDGNEDACCVYSVAHCDFKVHGQRFTGLRGTRRLVPNPTSPPIVLAIECLWHANVIQWRAARRYTINSTGLLRLQPSHQNCSQSASKHCPRGRFPKQCPRLIIFNTKQATITTPIVSMMQLTVVLPRSHSALCTYLRCCRCTHIPVGDARIHTKP